MQGHNKKSDASPITFTLKSADIARMNVRKNSQMKYLLPVEKKSYATSDI